METSAVQNFQDDSQTDSFLDESLYVEYLDDDFEYMDCMDDFNELDFGDNTNANGHVCDYFIDESESSRTDACPVNAYSYVYEIFLLLVLCLLFLVNILTKYITARM